MLLGGIDSTPMFTSKKTVAKPSQQKERKIPKSTYHVAGRTVCRDTFKFLYWYV